MTPQENQPSHENQTIDKKIASLTSDRVKNRRFYEEIHAKLHKFCNVTFNPTATQDTAHYEKQVPDSNSEQSQQNNDLQNTDTRRINIAISDSDLGVTMTSSFNAKCTKAINLIESAASLYLDGLYSPNWNLLNMQKQVKEHILSSCDDAEDIIFIDRIMHKTITSLQNIPENLQPEDKEFIGALYEVYGLMRATRIIIDDGKYFDFQKYRAERTEYERKEDKIDVTADTQKQVESSAKPVQAKDKMFTSRETLKSGTKHSQLNNASTSSYMNTETSTLLGDKIDSVSPSHTKDGSSGITR